MEAGWITALVSGCALILSPTFGILLDKIGYRGYSVLVSSFALTTSFVIILLSDNVALMFVAVGLIGFALSLISSGLWPCITFLVDEEAYGVAFGLMGCGINSAGLLMNYVLGIFFDEKRMDYAIISWLILGVLSVLISIWWNVLDYKTGGDAQKPASSLEEREETEEE